MGSLVVSRHIAQCADIVQCDVAAAHAIVRIIGQERFVADSRPKWLGTEFSGCPDFNRCRPTALVEVVKSIWVSVPMSWMRRRFQQNDQLPSQKAKLVVSMHGLSLTYQTLTTSRNQAASEVLFAAVDSANPKLMTMAVSAIVTRNDAQAPENLLKRWDKLDKKAVAVLQKASPWMDASVLEGLDSASEIIEIAIRAARDLQLLTAIEPMVLLAESHESESIRQAATDAILELVEPLGRADLQDKSGASNRNSVLACLSNSVARFSKHRNELLVEAFLCTTTGNDGDLRGMINEQGTAFGLVSERFRSSDHPSVIDLLASHLRRRNLHQRMVELIRGRTDDAFRDAMLDKIGSSPTANTIKNLQDMGIPSTCENVAALMPNLDTKRLAALVHLHTIAGSSTITIMQALVSAIKLGGLDCEPVAAKGLAQCEVLDIDFWMRAAVPVANNATEEIACDENAQLLQDLIDLLEHDNAAIVDGVRHVLSPMHATAMLPRMTKLRARSRRRIGRVVMMIDPDAIDRVRDALRHPVLDRRLEAITMADSLALVDLLSDSFSHISTEDHQQARIRAAEAMGEASGSETMQLLQSMVQMPVSPVRDAAESAIEQRENGQKSRRRKRLS